MHIQYDKRGDVIPLGAHHSLLLSFNLKGSHHFRMRQPSKELAAAGISATRRANTRFQDAETEVSLFVLAFWILHDHMCGEKNRVECTGAPKRLLSPPLLSSSRLRALHAAAPSWIETRLGDSSHDATEEVSQVSFSCFWVCVCVMLLTWFPTKAQHHRGVRGCGLPTSDPGLFLVSVGQRGDGRWRGEMSVTGQWSLFCDSKAERNEASALLWSTKVSINTFSQRAVVRRLLGHAVSAIFPVTLHENYH